jgi:hypothetical protein
VRDKVKAHLHAAPLRQLRAGQIQFFMPCVAPIWSGDASPRRPSYEEEGNGYYGGTGDCIDNGCAVEYGVSEW